MESALTPHWGSAFGDGTTAEALLPFQSVTPDAAKRRSVAHSLPGTLRNTHPPVQEPMRVDSGSALHLARVKLCEGTRCRTGMHLPAPSRPPCRDLFLESSKVPDQVRDGASSWHYPIRTWRHRTWPQSPFSLKGEGARRADEGAGQRFCLYQTSISLPRRTRRPLPTGEVTWRLLAGIPVHI